MSISLESARARNILRSHQDHVMTVRLPSRTHRKTLGVQTFLFGSNLVKRFWAGLLHVQGETTKFWFLRSELFSSQRDMLQSRCGH